jgi:hypothetical protein
VRYEFTDPRLATMLRDLRCRSSCSSVVPMSWWRSEGDIVAATFGSAS